MQTVVIVVHLLIVLALIGLVLLQKSEGGGLVSGGGGGFMTSRGTTNVLSRTTAILAGLLANRQIRDEEFVAGRPIKLGWVSSNYGSRTDPFHGSMAWHSGIDFAGRLGSEIVSVAGGVITASGEHNGYGRMVEINHGNGLVTRYAHNQKVLVNVGDTVQKGQSIALIGSTGRSTGPHLHFEVLKGGRQVNPISFIGEH